MSEPLLGTNNNITIEIVRIERNKKYECKKYGKDYDCFYDLCSDKRHFMVNPIAKEPLCATEIEAIITNSSASKRFDYFTSGFRLIDTNGFAYSASEPLCGRLQFGRYEYIGCTIQPNSQIKAIVCFPELEENINVHKICFEYGYDDNRRTINIPVAPLGESAQQRIDLLNKQKQNEQERQRLEAEEKHKEEVLSDYNHQYKRLKNAIDRLQWLSFQRLNNALTKSEKIRLENQIMNGEFEIKTQLLKLNDNNRQEIETNLSDIMTDYRKRVVLVGDTNSTVWERLSNEGAREDLGETVFRSSWEANIARILNSKGIHWEYETTPFMLDTAPYLPDFFLDDGTIMEIKGHWDNESITKVETFMRSNTETNYLIVDHDMYHDLTQMYADKMPAWEKVQASKEKVNVVIVGLAFVPDKAVIKNLQVGDVLQMELEPNNQYDKFAIAVKTANGGMVGHIEKKFAPIYAQKLKLGMTFSLDIISVEPKIIRAKAYRTNWEKPIVHSIFNSEA